MPRSLVCGRKKNPTTTVIAAKTTGYRRPASMSPVEATIANGERLWQQVLSRKSNAIAKSNASV